ncbi:MAG: M16 family metallopeptidase [Bacteroidia bacterium]
MDHLLIPLANGMHLIYKQVSGTEIAHAGFVVNAGSRDELPAEWGLAHFLEHMLFKGTHKRKAYHVLSRLDAVGGELNAYTTRERTCLHASFRNLHFGRAFDLLCDVFFNANFPEKELAREKLVVLEELLMYKDEHDESILDDFEELVFQNRPLGRPILGTENTINSFNRQMLTDFRARNYTAANTVFSYAGPMPWKQFERKVRPVLEAFSLAGSSHIRQTQYNYQPFYHEFSKPANTAYVVMGNQAYPANDTKRLGLLLLNNMLGGENLNSRLNMSIRERNGLVYGIESNYSPYSDTGLFYVFFSTDPKNRRRVQQLVMLELAKLRKKKLGNLQLHMAKQQFISRLLMAEENRSGLMLALAHSYFDHGRIDQLAEIIRKIEALDALDLLDITNEVFEPQQLSTIVYNPL